MLVQMNPALSIKVRTRNRKSSIVGDIIISYCNAYKSFDENYEKISSKNIFFDLADSLIDFQNADEKLLTAA